MISDEARARRLERARAPRPTPEQAEAVRRAYTTVAAIASELLPQQIDLRWQAPGRFEEGFNPEANACVGFLPDGGVILCLRVDRSAPSIYRSAVHEFTHMAHRGANPHAGHTDMEQVAEIVTARLAPDVPRWAD